MTVENDILRENIRIMAQVITEVCQRSTRKQASSLPLSRNHYYILKILSASGEQLIGDLAVALDISPAAATKNIDRLEKWNLVERRARPEDRRSLEVALIPDGQAIVSNFDLITKEKMDPLLAQFSDDEKNLLLGMLQRIVQFTVNHNQNTNLICLQCGGACGPNCPLEEPKGSCSKVPRQSSGK